MRGGFTCPIPYLLGLAHDCNFSLESMCSLLSALQEGANGLRLLWRDDAGNLSGNLYEPGGKGGNDFGALTVAGAFSLVGTAFFSGNGRCNAVEDPVRPLLCVWAPNRRRCGLKRAQLELGI